MKRIFITPKIERMAYDFSTTLFTDRNLTKFDMPKDKLQLLENTLRTNGQGVNMRTMCMKYTINIQIS